MILGCVADDFTGASDAASFLQAGGANVILSNGIPEREDEDILEAQAVVIALKTRTCPPGEAVDRSMAAFSWLKAHGARMLYFKYCSTFDSTENGNIGPVLDAALKRWDIPYTLLCPALLENGRSVKDGKLYVNGVLLEDSPMKDHPLNPMRDSRLKYLMERQSRYPCFNLGADELEREIRPYEKTGHYYLIPDYYEEKHGRMIAEQYGNLPLLSGGSGLLRMIARTWEPDEERNVHTPSRCTAPVILAGSCSEATRTQIRYYESKGGASLRIHPLRFVQGIQTMEHIRAFLEENKKRAGIVTLPSGLQYEVITEGKGKLAKATDQVKCHYEGTLIDGTLFDSSIKRGQPAVFGVNQVIPGWVEALQLMPEGSKWKLYIPSDLAYGAQGAGEMIPPHSTLVFEVELLEVLNK